MPNEVVWFDSTETGAPTLNNAAGSLIGVLDACLVNGFNLKSVTSIVVASNVATVTASAHGYATGKVVTHAGATPSGLNGRARITVTGANTYTFPTSGIADGTATGTITAIRSPLGWSKAHTGTNKAAYARTAVGALAQKLRIDDTAAGNAAATYARAVMYETMSDVDTGTGPAPTVAMIAAGQYWWKGANNTNAKKWTLVGSDHAFYLLTEGVTYPASSNYGGTVYGFGSLVSYRPGDAYSSFLLGTTVSEISLFPTSVTVNHSFAASTDYYCVVSRPYNQIGSAALIRGMAPGGSAVIGGNAYPVYPSPVDNGLVVAHPYFVVEQGSVFSNPIRGHFPGLYVPLGNLIGLLDRTVLSNIVGFTGDMLCLETHSQTNRGAVLFDISNPWS